MKEFKECSYCKGYGEIMVRDRYVDSDGSEDIGGTSYPQVCMACKGEGKITINEEKILDEKSDG